MEGRRDLDRFTFWLGTHKIHWLGRLSVPLFFSRRQLITRVVLPRALGPWVMDSGGFSELHDFGRWTVSARDYVTECLRWRDQAGPPQWIAIQDWMCEELIIQGGTYKKFGKTITVPGTKLSVIEHQKRTIASWFELNAIEPSLPWMPVLQGFHLEEYLRHLEMYRSFGVDLETFPVVGIGSVCRRQAWAEAEEIMRNVAKRGVRLHGFGVKLDGLRQSARWLVSADSLAWSFDARYAPPMPGHTHATCANCPEYALAWREKALAAVREGLSEETEDASRLRLRPGQHAGPGRKRAR